VTNQQIHEVCTGLVKIISVAEIQGSDPVRLYEEFAYRLLYAAYEEAAQIADTANCNDGPHCGCQYFAARDIRVLKDVLEADLTVKLSRDFR
jgi:hypothetical protein